jgi:hypothetical protein
MSLFWLEQNDQFAVETLTPNRLVGNANCTNVVVNIKFWRCPHRNGPSKIIGGPRTRKLAWQALHAKLDGTRPSSRAPHAWMRAPALSSSKSSMCGPSQKKIHSKSSVPRHVLYFPSENFLNLQWNTLLIIMLNIFERRAVQEHTTML